MTSLVIGLIVAMIGLFVERSLKAFFPDAGYLAASLFVGAAGLLSTGLAMRARPQTRSKADAPDEQLPDPVGWATKSKRRQKLRRLLLNGLRVALGWLDGWLPVIASVLLGAMALASVIATWTSHDAGMLPAQARQAVGGLLTVFAFPLLVLERIYANIAPQVLREAPQLERLLRVPLVTFLGLGITSVLLSFGLDWPSMIARAIAILIGLVSLELVLRGLAAAFLPLSRERSCADSTIAGLLRLTPPTPATFSSAVKRQLGIDLSRSWALAFARRAGWAIGLGMAFTGWCLTGVTALNLSERAVYERLGTPVAVFGPGLHIHLPWPLGVLHPVELGVVHEMPIVFSANNQTASDNGAAGALGIEDVPPRSADRLWDTSHPGEASYLIASESQGQQSFQIVNIDLRLVYRIGLSDAAAREAAYAIDEPEELLRAIAGQLLVRYFAHNKLLDVLVENRERFAFEFRTELQNELQGLPTGIEVIAVIVEAIHPPPGAASAYHNVQAAEILAQSQIALRRADAIAQLKFAQQEQAKNRDNAFARGSELVNRAQAEGVLFDGDRQAHKQDGQAFLLERWLHHLTGALVKSALVVIDHRLKGPMAPTVDLRKFEWPGPADQAAPAGQGEAEGD